jgi:gluconokinase
MPPALLDSQLATLEIPSTDEAVLTLDIAEPADLLVAQIEHHLQLNLA